MRAKKKTAEVVNLLMSRVPCSDDEFVSACAMDSLSADERAFIIKLRSCIAELAMVPETSIYATDTFDDIILCLPFWNDFDESLFVSKLSSNVNLTFEEKQLEQITHPEISPINYTVRDFTLEWIRVLRHSTKAAIHFK